MNAITPDNYEHSIDPFDHQKDHLEKHWRDTAYGLLWEQGTAKTKPIIDTASLLYLNNEIDGLLVVAPPGVERNWRSDEIPKHMPADVALDAMVEVFQTAKKHTKNHKALMERLVKHDGLAVCLISYNAFMTKDGKNFVWKFLRHRRCLYVLDEAHNIKSPGAKRTKSIIASGKYATHRRILTGTPIAVGPFDIYAQIRFLDENFWKRKGIGGALEFRKYFGEWLTREECQRELGYDPGFDQLIRYKNLDKLEQWITEITDRVLKDDVLDLPPKLYSKRYFEMTKEQKAVYDQLANEYMVEFDDGTILDGELPIVRLLRFQQILCNYIPVVDLEDPDSATYRTLGDKNPRLNAMEEIRDEVYQPTIVWARFRQDVDQLMDLLGKKAVRYDGLLTDDEAERSKLAFQAGDADWFVGTAQKGGPGLTLTQAKNMVYYSNSFKLIDRLQSEDRAHRAGMDEHPVNYIDICCSNGHIDENIITNLREKRVISSQLLRDEMKSWI
ncbi:MAG: hypothetical protein Tp138OMZ00d2C19078261_55 [Prokaryotic dsDNA virus sp.]|jgi:SNF2 family DNA or RNA helicase|nr:MAG: hypothetical protein Tp138OMZ00d2C19078261_55 [Prokaryotic dsDNA virus sp.]|tara:strand:- start:1861 stop:3360 length:1500 start_codon:yes stop_codon:yes gene_type:complete